MIEGRKSSSRAGSRLQNRACDQCRRSKRRCELAEAGPDGLPVYNAGPCRLCVRKQLNCTSHWADLHHNSTLSDIDALRSSDRTQMVLKTGQNSSLSNTVKVLNQTVDRMLITSEKLAVYVSVWEWSLQHFLGADCAPSGIGLDVVDNSRFGLVGPSITKIWDEWSMAQDMMHIPPRFLFAAFACDEAYRPMNRIQRLPPRAHEISNQAIKYAILAFAAQYGPNGLNADLSGMVRDPVKISNDIEVAEATWTKARDFLFQHSTVCTFRNAIALILFGNAMPPLRTQRSDSDPIQDAFFAAQTGLRMLSQLVKQLQSQQEDRLYALANPPSQPGSEYPHDYYSLTLQNETHKEHHLGKTKALIGIVENLKWFITILDVALSATFRTQLITEHPPRDELDLESELYMLEPKHTGEATPSAFFQVEKDWTKPSVVSFESVPPPFNFARGKDICQDVDPVKNNLSTSYSGNSIFTGSSSHMAVEAIGQGGRNSMLATQGIDPIHFTWTKIHQRTIALGQKIPPLLAILRQYPHDPMAVRQFLTCIQAASAAQLLIWRRVTAFVAFTQDSGSDAKALTSSFRSGLASALFVIRSYQPLLELDDELYFQLPAAAQSTVAYFINHCSSGVLHFLEACSEVERQPWLRKELMLGSAKASLILLPHFEASRALRNTLRRMSALRILQTFSRTERQLARMTSLPTGLRPERSASSQSATSWGGGHYFPQSQSEQAATWSPPINLVLPQDEVNVPALQIEPGRHPVPVLISDCYHIAICALVPDAVEEIRITGAVSATTIDSIDAGLTGIQQLADKIISFGLLHHREPTVVMLFSTRNMLVPERPPLALAV